MASPPSTWADRVSDFAVLGLLVWAAWVMGETATVYPALNPDESGAFLGLQLLRGSYGFTIAPAHAGSGNSEFFGTYPPVYYLFNAAVFSVAGFSPLTARSVTIGFMLTAGWLAYFSASRRAGLWAGLLALTAFFHLVPIRVYPWVVNRPDIAANFFLFLTVTLLAPGHSPAKPTRFAAIGFAYGLSVFSHFLGLMAAPVIAVAGLWAITRSPGAKSTRLGAIAAIMGGFGFVAVCYAWAAGHHVHEVLGHLMTYHPEASNRTPPWKQHLAVLRESFPHLLWLLCVMPLILVGAINSKLRDRLGDSIYFASIAAGLLLAVSFYPNISLIWFYGLSYIYCAIVAFGIALPSGLRLLFGNRSHISKALITALCILMLANRVASFHSANMGNRASVDHIPISASLHWLNSVIPTEARVLGPLTLVFSGIGERIRDVIRLTNYDGRIDFPEATPSKPRVADFNAVVIDVFKSSDDADQLLRANRRWRRGMGLPPERSVGAVSLLIRQDFQKVGEIIDSRHTTGNLSVFAREGTGPSKPIYAMATQSGPVALDTYDTCSRSIPVTQELTEMANDELWGLEFPLSWPTFSRYPLRIRLRLDRMPGLAMMAYYPNAEIAASRHYGIVREASYGLDQNSSLDKVSLAGSPLNNGGFEMEMLVAAPPSNDGRVAIYANTRAHIQTIDIAVMLPQENGCEETQQTLATQIAKSIQSAMDHRGRTP